MAENIREPRIMVEPTPPGDINSLRIFTGGRKKDIGTFKL